jgi:hypothetical protein
MKLYRRCIDEKTSVKEAQKKIKEIIASAFERRKK